MCFSTSDNSFCADVVARLRAVVDEDVGATTVWDATTVDVEVFVVCANTYDNGDTNNTNCAINKNNNFFIVLFLANFTFLQYAI